MFKSIAVTSGVAVMFAAALAAQPQQEKPDSTRPPTNTQTPAKGGSTTDTNTNTKGKSGSTTQSGQSGQSGTNQPGTTTTPQKGATGASKKDASSSNQGMTKAATGPAAAFMKRAAQDGQAEVELAQLATSKATDPQVKAYAQMLATDHGKANDELMSIAKTKNVTLSTDMGAAQKATHDKLDKLSGASFDHTYIADMVKDHQTAIREFETASKSSDADVKAFAEKTLPTLRHHLEEAQRLSKSTSAAGKTTSTKGTGTASKKSGKGQ